MAGITVYWGSRQTVTLMDRVGGGVIGCVCITYVCDTGGVEWSVILDTYGLH